MQQNERVMEMDVTNHDKELETIMEEYIVKTSRNLVTTAQKEWYEVGTFCVFQDEESLFPGRIQKIC